MTCHRSSSSAEWAPHEAVWIGFPRDPDLWLADLKEAETRSRGLCQGGSCRRQGRTGLAGRGSRGRRRHRRAKLAPFAKVIVEPFGDIWLRDTRTDRHRLGQAAPRAGLPLQRLGQQVRSRRRPGHRRAARAEAASCPTRKADWVLEGGAIDGDGSGTVLTTEQCLLNPNRNPGCDARGHRGAAGARSRLRAGRLARRRA